MRRFVYICLLLLAFASSAVADVWTHRAAITVNNAGGMVTDYTLRVSFGASDSLLFDWSRADGADWRFRKKDGLTTLNHWMQWWGTDRDTAIVLVRLDTLQPGTDTLYVYVGNDTALSTSNGAAVSLLFQDFNTDYTASGVTDILHMQGLGIDSCRRIMMDTCAAEDQWQRFEESNVFCLSNPALYLHLYSARDSGQSTGDFSYTYQETSPDGFIWTRKGRIDTLGGGTPDTNARGEDSYIIQWPAPPNDTLWEYYEDKRFSRVPPLYPDACGMWYSANRGTSWISYGLVDGVNEPNNWLYNHQTEVASPAAIVVGDTIWLMLEGPAGARHIGCFWSLHPKGPWHLRKIFYNNTVPGGYWYLTGVPDQLFSINDTIYMDSHCRIETTPTWLHTRYRMGANFDTLLDTRIFDQDSMIMGTGSIISQDVLGDCTWISWTIAPYGGYNINKGRNVRRRTTFTDPAATPSGWSALWINSTFGFNEARNGLLTLAAEPWREDRNNSAIALRSNMGFDSNFVLEYRQRLKWDTLGPFAVVSFGSSNPAPVEEVPLYSYRMATDSGYLIKYGSGNNGVTIARKVPDLTWSGTSSFTVHDTLLNTWRVHHLAFGPNDTLRFWMDGLASSPAHKRKDATFNMNAKRILFASGETKNKDYVPRGSQMYVDWLLVRPYQYPEPTATLGPLEDSRYNYTHFDTVLYADHDACLHAGNPTFNYGMRDSLLAGQSSGSPVYSLFHFDFSGLDSGLTIASVACSLYVNSCYGGPLISLYSINYDWFEGAKRGAAADSHECCWNWRGHGSGSVTNGTIPQAEMGWGSPVIGPMACGSASIGTTGWFSWYVTGLVQSLVDAGPETAYGLAAYSPSPGTNAWCRFDSREFANRPRLRVTGYYCVPIPPQPTVVAQEEDGYLRLHWTNTRAALYRVLSSTTAGGPYSLLLSTSDTTATVARTDTAGAQHFYRVVSATE